jgi:hypothetical protein
MPNINSDGNGNGRSISTSNIQSSCIEFSASNVRSISNSSTAIDIGAIFINRCQVYTAFVEVCNESIYLYASN